MFFFFSGVLKQIPGQMRVGVPYIQERLVIGVPYAEYTKLRPEGGRFTVYKFALPFNNISIMEFYKQNSLFPFDKYIDLLKTQTCRF